MKKKTILTVSTFLLWTFIFILQKPVFLLVYGGLGHIAQVIWHGLPLDMSMAGYLAAVPALVILAGTLPFLYGPRTGKWLKGIAAAWTAAAAIIVATAFTANIALYGYWRFPLDSTPLFFLSSSPSAAMASVEWWQAVLGIAAIIIIAALICAAFHLLWQKSASDIFITKPSRWQWLPQLLLTALLFLPIRGGVTVSTMNTGRAYFSQTETLNHAAVNPLLSFMESVAHSEDFADMYRFMNDAEAHRLFRAMAVHSAGNRPRLKLLTGNRQTGNPDIYIVILESFSDTLTRQPGVTPNLNAAGDEGTSFSNFYANGFRTDRGLVSILLGYPAPGSLSLMKYPRKTARIPSLASHLKKAGYDLHYYYGGDADFTNMRSFLVNQGFEKITEDIDFPVADRISKWGVPDHLLFRRVMADIKQRRGSKPAFTVIQTSSSHEPFDVACHRLKNKKLNAFAYTDSCIGAFTRFMKTQKSWKNTLVIFVPDHLGAWPDEIDNFSLWHFHIPMVWTGGRARAHTVVDVFGSQQDIAATVLGQLGIAHGDMPFSKDIADPAITHYAYFMPNDGFGMTDGRNAVVYDNKQRRTVLLKGNKKYVKQGQAVLQVIFDDIAGR